MIMVELRARPWVVNEFRTKPPACTLLGFAIWKSGPRASTLLLLGVGVSPHYGFCCGAGACFHFGVKIGRAWFEHWFPYGV